MKDLGREGQSYFPYNGKGHSLFIAGMEVGMLEGYSFTFLLFWGRGWGGLTCFIWLNKEWKKRRRNISIKLRHELTFCQTWSYLVHLEAMTTQRLKFSREVWHPQGISFSTLAPPCVAMRIAFWLSQSRTYLRKFRSATSWHNIVMNSKLPQIPQWSKWNTQCL